MSLVGFRARNHPQQRINPDVDDRATEPAFFALLHAEFEFTLDACALPHNAKLDRYVTPMQDADTTADAAGRERRAKAVARLPVVCRGVSTFPMGSVRSFPMFALDVLRRVS